MNIKKILFLILCLFSMQSHSMAQTKLTDLPDEMLLDIILTTIKPLNLIEAAESINSLSLTSHQFQRLVQDNTVRQILAQKIKDPKEAQKILFDFAETKKEIGPIAAQIVISELKQAGADVDAQDDHGETALIKAVKNSQENIVKALINAKAALNIESHPAATALTKAAEIGHESIVKALINAGANVNIQNRARATPLFFAATNGHESIVKALINAGADVSLKNIQGKTARDFAETPEIRTILEEAQLQQQAHRGLKKLKLDDPDA